MLIPLLLLTVGGMFLALALCPITKIAWQFVRLIAVIVLAVTTVVAVWFVYQGLWRTGRLSIFAAASAVLAGLFALTVIVISPLLHSHHNKTSRLLRMLLVLGGTAGLVAGLLWPEAAKEAQATVRVSGTISHLLSGFFMGSVTVAWLLGHRYLTASEMTIDPLKKASQLLLIALAARWGFLVGMLAMGVLSPAVSDSATGPLARLMADWLMVSMRIGIGLVLPTVFAYMVWHCVKLRSTQSATGILFFMLIFVVIGELAGRHWVGKSGFVL